ncbi:hypothetical protein R2601_13494 [Salipiger bermudensis HTCC2601]|uniref:Uncharacterized protein n=1 Tax=Salipiger bermudensis (strain DSM 26914 / JCM 13377 / KCTC 12554 / HTCC2601) TaxID=314265 RepID=Q0FRL5_SALBH|nr:hypothetical protein R2601_13494 [Salipiger bermudensis HTCC2601]
MVMVGSLLVFCTHPTLYHFIEFANISIEITMRETFFA